jgi:hypothetical protein
MNTLEKMVKTTEDELAALKSFFQRTATTMPVHTFNTSIDTAENKWSVNFDYAGNHYEYENSAMERVMVTFSTTSGRDTIANIEVSTNNPRAVFPLVIQRVRYSGGARWIICVDVLHDDDWNRLPTHLDIQVNSMVDGTLSAENMRS